MKQMALLLIRFYQKTLSKVIPSNCRYDPSCSHYTYQAIQIHGFFKGIVMGMERISRCHPLGPSGYDPVPPAKHHQHEKHT